MSFHGAVYAVIAAVFFCVPARASENRIRFTPEDRVLIVAPHPDDEVLGVGGTLQAARDAGADIRIVYLTHGESNEISSLLYQRKPLLVKSDFIKIGDIRKNEAIEAMSVLGLQPDKLIFFGYPDQGTMRIWHKHWGGMKPFRSFFTRINKVIHKSDFSYGKYYKGDSILQDFEEVLLSFRPTHAFVTAPFDLHPDHKAACLYLNVALMDVADRLQTRPAVHYYVIHAHGWPERKPNTPELKPPRGVNEAPHWVSFPLTAEQKNTKAEALLRYKSQVAYNRDFLMSFVRSNELHYDDGAQGLLPVSSAPDTKEAALSEPAIGYDVHDKDFYCDLSLKSAFDEIGVTAMEIFSYKKGTTFSAMPKLSLRLVGSKLFAYDWTRTTSVKGVTYKLWKKRLLVKVPLSVLKDPEVLFVTVSTSQKELGMDSGAWKILKLGNASPS